MQTPVALPLGLWFEGRGPMARDRRRCVVTPSSSWSVVALALCLSFASGCGDDDSVAPLPPPPAALPALQRLHAVRGPEPGVFDEQGRRVLLRGVNLNSLGDYYQGNPNHPPVVPLRDDDFERMASYGFNVVRLIVSWSFLEPQRGVFDRDYVARVRAAVEKAKAAGVYVVLDMHQDAWGKFIATPPGVDCGGKEAAIGWDGAPEWATLTDGKSTCRNRGMRELSAAVITAFDNFYADRDGIQSRLVATWAALAGEFADEPAVAGYDLLNEPHFGKQVYDPGPQLGQFTARAVEAIRAAEQAAGGFAHVVFFEPAIVWPAVGKAAFAPEFLADDNIVFAPHNYAESINVNILSIEETFARAAADAARYRSTFWIGEFGFFGDPAAQKPLLLRYAREEDRQFVGGTWWQWRQACGDPHTIGRTGGEPGSTVIHFLGLSCPGDVEIGVTPVWAGVLSRSYPRAAPGRLLGFESDPDARTMRLSGEGAASGSQVDLWVPRGAAAPRVSGSGIASSRMIEVPGGYRIFADVAGSYEVRID